MRPIPVQFKILFLTIHTYGIGLALTFWFAYWYFERRLRRNGYDSSWLAGAFVWIIVASIAGARAVHVAANFRTLYEHHLGQVFAIWQGGLSSFGGLAFGTAVGIWQVRTKCRELSTVTALDLVAPVLMASWAIGRLLGPQMMINGGGHPTNQWFGMRYACTPGLIGCNANGISVKELPAPIFQAIESFAVYLVLLQIERWVARRGGPRGMVIAGMAAFWGLARLIDELLWLDVNPPPDAVEVTGAIMSAAGFATMGYLWWRDAHRTPIRLGEESGGDTGAEGAEGSVADETDPGEEAGGKAADQAAADAANEESISS